MSSVSDPRRLLRALYDAAVARALPSQNLAAFLPAPPRGRTVVLGAGKASAAMAEAIDAAWPKSASLSGLVITRYGHVPPSYRDRRIEVMEAGHPLPDAAGAEATQRLVHLAGGLTADDLVLCPISGGGSALLSHPAAGITLSEKRAIHEALLKSGAAIDEMNCVRKHLSSVKAGRLALACAPAQVVTLLISDVPGDAPDVIASGPTVPDRSTCAEALAILARHGIAIRENVRKALVSNETPKPGDPRFAGHAVHMVATPRESLLAAADVARAAGVTPYILGDDLEGESREVGKVLAALARNVARRGEPFAAPCVLLSGGETTVTMKRDGGRGGRATELLLGCAIALHGEPDIFALAADTDGIDGTEDNAGAIVTPDTIRRAQAGGLDPQALLDAHRAYDFFEPLGDLVTTGPTFTNVNDFRALLVV